jgi:hypothetical protein
LLVRGRARGGILGWKVIVHFVQYLRQCCREAIIAIKETTEKKNNGHLVNKHLFIVLQVEEG